MADAVASLEEAAREGRLNSEQKAEAICGDLIKRSPIADKIHEDVWVTEGYWVHLHEHDPFEIRKRLKHVGWIEPTLIDPLEIWQPKANRSRRFYLTCVRYIASEEEKRQFVVVIVDNAELQGRLSVATMYMLRPRQVKGFRIGRKLWPLVS